MNKLGKRTQSETYNVICQKLFISLGLSYTFNMQVYVSELRENLRDILVNDLYDDLKSDLKRKFEE